MRAFLAKLCDLLSDPATEPELPRSSRDEYERAGSLLNGEHWAEAASAGSSAARLYAAQGQHRLSALAYELAVSACDAAAKEAGTEQSQWSSDGLKYSQERLLQLGSVPDLGDEDLESALDDFVVRSNSLPFSEQHRFLRRLQTNLESVGTITGADSVYSVRQFKTLKHSWATVVVAAKTVRPLVLVQALVPTIGLLIWAGLSDFGSSASRLLAAAIAVLVGYAVLYSTVSVFDEQTEASFAHAILVSLASMVGLNAPSNVDLTTTGAYLAASETLAGLLLFGVAISILVTKLRRPTR